MLLLHDCLTFNEYHRGLKYFIEVEFSAYEDLGRIEIDIRDLLIIDNSDEEVTDKMEGIFLPAINDRIWDIVEDKWRD